MIAREEWDFSKVPREQLILCRDYEYNREYVIRKGKVEAWEKYLEDELAKEWTAFGPDTPPTNLPFPKSPHEHLTGWPRYPFTRNAQPFPRVDNKTKTKFRQVDLGGLIKECQYDEMYGEEIPCEFDYPKRQNRVIIAAFQFDLMDSRDALEKAFSEWLKKRETGITKRQNRGREVDPFCDLEALSALRLHRAFKNVARAISHAGLFNQDETAWSRAEARAKMILQLKP